MGRNGKSDVSAPTPSISDMTSPLSGSLRFCRRWRASDSKTTVHATHDARTVPIRIATGGTDTLVLVGDGDGERGLSSFVVNGN